MQVVFLYQGQLLIDKYCIYQFHISSIKTLWANSLVLGLAGFKQTIQTTKQNTRAKQETTIFSPISKFMKLNTARIRNVIEKT